MVVVWVLLTVVLNVSGHLLAKQLSGIQTPFVFLPESNLVDTALKTLPVASIFGASLFFWVLALREAPLSAAYPFLLAGLTVTPLISSVVFREPMGTLQGSLLGVAALILVVAGLRGA